MFYTQSTAKAHIGAEQTIPTTSKKSDTWDTFHHWGLEKFGENEVEWAGKAETRLGRSPVGRHSMHSYILTYYRLRKMEPLIERSPWFLHPRHPTVGFKMTSRPGMSWSLGMQNRLGMTNSPETTSSLGMTWRNMDGRQVRSIPHIFSAVLEGAAP